MKTIGILNLMKKHYWKPKLNSSQYPPQKGWFQMPKDSTTAGMLGLRGATEQKQDQRKLQVPPTGLLLPDTRMNPYFNSIFLFY